jgi:hypothetical protein
METTMQLSAEQRLVLRRLLDAPADFATLVEIAGLDPRRDFRGVDLSNVDFGCADISDFDFSGADLEGANTSRAVVGDALTRAGRLDRARPDEILTSRAQLAPYQRAAIDVVIDHLRAGGNRALVAMPAGLGARGVMSGVIAALKADTELRCALVLVGRGVLTEEVFYALNSQFPHYLVNYFRTGDYTSRNKILIAAASGRYHSASKLNKFLTNQNGKSLPAISHIIIDDVTKCSDNLLSIISEYKEKVIGLISDKSFEHGVLKTVFPKGALFNYKFSDAVRDGHARPIELVDYSKGGDWRPLAAWPPMPGQADVLAQILSNEIKEVGKGRVRGGFSGAMIVFLFDDHAPIDAIFKYMVDIFKVVKFSLGLNARYIDVILRNEKDDIVTRSAVTKFIVCKYSDFDLDLSIKADRIVVLGRKYPAGAIENWLSLAVPFTRSIIDYGGEVISAFLRSTQHHELADVVQVRRSRMDFDPG